MKAICPKCDKELLYEGYSAILRMPIYRCAHCEYYSPSASGAPRFDDYGVPLLSGAPIGVYDDKTEDS